MIGQLGLFRSLIFFGSSTLCMFIGAQCVHIYYQPLAVRICVCRGLRLTYSATVVPQDLDQLVEVRKKELREEYEALQKIRDAAKANANTNTG